MVYFACESLSAEIAGDWEYAPRPDVADGLVTYIGPEEPLDMTIGDELIRVDLG